MTATTSLVTQASDVCVSPDTGAGLFMGSRNHAYVQVNLAIAFAKLQQFVVFFELSLDTRKRMI